MWRNAYRGEHGLELEKDHIVDDGHCHFLLGLIVGLFAASSESIFGVLQGVLPAALELRQAREVECRKLHRVHRARVGGYESARFLHLPDVVEELQEFGQVQAASVRNEDGLAHLCLPARRGGDLHLPQQSRLCARVVRDAAFDLRGILLDIEFSHLGPRVRVLFR